MHVFVYPRFPFVRLISEIGSYGISRDPLVREHPKIYVKPGKKCIYFSGKGSFRKPFLLRVYEGDDGKFSSIYLSVKSHHMKLSENESGEFKKLDYFKLPSTEDKITYRNYISVLKKILPNLFVPKPQGKVKIMNRKKAKTILEKNIKRANRSMRSITKSRTFKKKLNEVLGNKEYINNNLVGEGCFSDAMKKYLGIYQSKILETNE